MESILQNAAMSQLEIAQRLKQNLTEKHNLMFQNVLHFFSAPILNHETNKVTIWHKLLQTCGLDSEECKGCVSDENKNCF